MKFTQKQTKIIGYIFLFISLAIIIRYLAFPLFYLAWLWVSGGTIGGML